MPEGVVGPDGEDVEPVRSPCHGGRARVEHAAERFPAAPGVAVPPAMPEGVVGPDGENVEPVESPRHGGRGRVEDAAERLPAAQALPSHQRCQRAWSVPTAKTSSRFGPQLTASGAERTTPPSDCHGHQRSGIWVTVFPWTLSPMMMELS